MSFWKFIIKIVLIVFLFTLMLVYLIQHNYVMRINYEKQAYKKQLTELRRENELLAIEASKQSSLAQIDAAAVSDLGMVKPKELKFIVVEGSL